MVSGCIFFMQIAHNCHNLLSSLQNPQPVKQTSTSEKNLNKIKISITLKLF